MVESLCTGCVSLHVSCQSIEKKLQIWKSTFEHTLGGTVSTMLSYLIVKVKMKVLMFVSCY